MNEEFGDFKEIKEEHKPIEHEQETQTRIKTPKKGEFIGIVKQRLGGNRMEILSSDGKTRNCRVPGRFKRKFWLRPGDIVIITPWPDDDSKGDVIFQYSKNSAQQLKNQGFLKNLNLGF